MAGVLSIDMITGLEGFFLRFLAVLRGVSYDRGFIHSEISVLIIGASIVITGLTAYR